MSEKLAYDVESVHLRGRNANEKTKREANCVPKIQLHTGTDLYLLPPVAPAPPRKPKRYISASPPTIAIAITGKKSAKVVSAPVLLP